MAKGKSKTGGRDIHPTDAFRKQQRKKELKHNKIERKKVREVSDLLNNPQKIEDEIVKLQKESDENKLDKKLKDRIKELKMMKSIAIKKQRNKEVGRVTFGETPTSTSTKTKDSSTSDSSNNLPETNPPPIPSEPPPPPERRPEESIYYHPQFNPTGAPPPGQPPLYRTIAPAPPTAPLNIPPPPPPPLPETANYINYGNILPSNHPYSVGGGGGLQANVMPSMNRPPLPRGPPPAGLLMGGTHGIPLPPPRPTAPLPPPPYAPPMPILMTAPPLLPGSGSIQSQAQPQPQPQGAPPPAANRQAFVQQQQYQRHHGHQAVTPAIDPLDPSADGYRERFGSQTSTTSRSHDIQYDSPSPFPPSTPAMPITSTVMEPSSANTQSNQLPLSATNVSSSPMETEVDVFCGPSLPPPSHHFSSHAVALASAPLPVPVPPPAPVFVTPTPPISIRPATTKNPAEIAMEIMKRRNQLPAAGDGQGTEGPAVLGPAAGPSLPPPAIRNSLIAMETNSSYPPSLRYPSTSSSSNNNSNTIISSSVISAPKLLSSVPMPESQTGVRLQGPKLMKPDHELTAFKPQSIRNKKPQNVNSSISKVSAAKTLSSTGAYSGTNSDTPMNEFSNSNISTTATTTTTSSRGDVSAVDDAYEKFMNEISSLGGIF